MTAVKLLSKKLPWKLGVSIDTSRVDIAIKIIYRIKKFCTEDTVLSPTGFLSILSEYTERGDSVLRKFRKDDFDIIISLDTFIPPEVEPAEPPIIITATSMTCDIVDQPVKSAVPKPVVDITDATLKALYLNASPTFPPVLRTLRSTVMANTATKKIINIHISSSLRIAFKN